MCELPSPVVSVDGQWVQVVSVMSSQPQAITSYQMFSGQIKQASKICLSSQRCLTAVRKRFDAKRLKLYVMVAHNE